ARHLAAQRLPDRVTDGGIDLPGHLGDRETMSDGQVEVDRQLVTEADPDPGRRPAQPREQAVAAASTENSDAVGPERGRSDYVGQRPARDQRSSRGLRRRIGGHAAGILPRAWVVDARWLRARSGCYHTAPLAPSSRACPCVRVRTPFDQFRLRPLEDPMARSCAICGKVSMGGFNPQSSGMNRVRAHRRYQPNLQPFTIRENGTEMKALVCTRCRRTSLKAAK